MNLYWFLLELAAIFVACGVVSFLLGNIARVLFPKFRSGEHKPGNHRPDLPVGRREIKTIELPLVGGPAFIIAMVGVGIVAGYFLHFDRDQWALLLIGLGATLGYAIVGFIDDWRKVYSNEGLSEWGKFSGLFLVGAIAAILYFFLLPKSGQVSYSFWKDLPLINTLLCAKPTSQEFCPVAPNQVAYYAWLVFLILLVGFTSTLTALCVDFSDGFDGLAGGLVFSASLALGIVVAGIVGKQPSGVVLEVLALLSAGGVLGYLPLNWPSSWAARHAKAKRRARVIMGDSGALGLGCILAMIALFSRNEMLLFMIGGAFVLEGLSAFIQRYMTRFFRRQLQSLRFASSKEFVPHTEFPLPFLATPLHHHFDLLGWDRRRIVYGAWALGAGFAALGVIVSIAPFTWQRYVGRFLVFVLAAIVWSSGSWSKNYFVGEHPAERTRRRRLALYYGYPYKLMGIRMYHLVEIIEASEDVIETPAEDIALWQRMNICDARSMLGLYCYRAGYYPAALAQWTRIPESNRNLRPEIEHLLEEVDNRLALEQQETQPMRRDQILRQQPVIYSGNLSPADLPNPHEPVRSEETEDEHTETWSPQSSYPINTNNHDNPEEIQAATPLQNDASAHAYSNGYNNNNVSGQKQSSLTLDSVKPSRRQNWLAKILRL